MRLFASMCNSGKVKIFIKIPSLKTMNEIVADFEDPHFLNHMK